jgi:hypothetical protein
MLMVQGERLSQEEPPQELRQGSYFPEWLLERRRRAGQALISVVATSCLLGA